VSKAEHNIEQLPARFHPEFPRAGRRDGRRVPLHHAFQCSAKLALWQAFSPKTAGKDVAGVLSGQAVCLWHMQSSLQEVEAGAKLLVSFV